MEVNTNKKERCSVGVKVSDEPSVIYISADVGYGREGCGDIGSVVHSEE